MASDAQVAAFASAWAPYAAQVGQSRGIDPNVLLAQWGMESDYGTNRGSQQNNVAGVTANGVPGQWASYSSPQAFSDAFSDLLARNYSGTTGTGSNTMDYVQALGSGRIGSYYGSQSADSYAAALQGAANRIAGVAPDAVASADSGSWFGNAMRWLTAAPPAGQTTPLVTLPSDKAGADKVAATLPALTANIAVVALGAALVVVIVAAGALGRGPAVVLKAGAKGATGG